VVTKAKLSPKKIKAKTARLISRLEKIRLIIQCKTVDENSPTVFIFHYDVLRVMRAAKPTDMSPSSATVAPGIPVRGSSS